MKQFERRTTQCEFRVAEDKKTIFGYAAVYGVRSEDMGGWVEIVSPGAFDTHLATKPTVKGLFNHDSNLILGSTASGTMRVNSDKTGLAYEIDVPDTTAARDLMVSMGRGDVNQSSFGFMVQDASWGYDTVTGVDVRTIKEAQVFDCSPVVFPAYPDATSGVRSLPSDMPHEVRSKVTKRMDSEDIADGNDNGCDCSCVECMAGNCTDCSNDQCDDPNCLANQTSRSLVDADANRRMAIRVGFATLCL